MSLSSQKYGFGIRDPEKTYLGLRIPDPGFKKAPDPGSGSATLVDREVNKCPHITLASLKAMTSDVMTDLDREIIIHACKKFQSRIF